MSVRSLVGALAALVVVFGAEAQAQQKLSKPDIVIARPVTVLIHGAAVDAAFKMNAFEAEGLKVTVSNFRGWTEVVQAMLSDSGVFGFGGASLIRSVLGQNASVRQIAQVSTLYPYNFWARGDAGIKTVADIKGKRIQTVRAGETLDLVWTEVLAADGVKMTDVTRVEGFEGFGALAAKTVDIANLNESLFAKARQAGFVRIVDYNDWRKKKGLETTGANNLGWGTSQATLDKHPDTVKAFLRALTKATMKLRTDEAFARELLSGAPYKMEPDAISEAYAMHKNSWVIRMDPTKGDFQFDIDKARDALKLDESKIDRARFVATQPSAEVMKELGVKY